MKPKTILLFLIIVGAIQFLFVSNNTPELAGAVYAKPLLLSVADLLKRLFASRGRGGGRPTGPLDGLSDSERAARKEFSKIGWAESGYKPVASPTTGFTNTLGTTQKILD